MAGLPINCPNCGVFEDTYGIELAGNNVRLTIKDIFIECYQCGARAKYVDGTYSTVEGIVTHFTNSDLSPNELEKVVDTLKKLNDGYLSDAEAVVLLANVRPWLRDIAEILAEHKDLISLMVAIVIPLLIAAYQEQSSNISSDQAHRDAQNIINLQKQTRDEIVKLSNARAFKVIREPLKPGKVQKRSRNGVKAIGNRHDRRKAAKTQKYKGGK